MDQKRPRYTLEQGKAVYDGDFSDSFSVPRLCDTLFLHSALYPKLRPLFYLFASSEQDMALHAAIVAQSAAQLHARNTDFAVIAWPDMTRFIDSLQARSLKVLPLSPAFPTGRPRAINNTESTAFTPILLDMQSSLRRRSSISRNSRRPGTFLFFKEK